MAHQLSVKDGRFRLTLDLKDASLDADQDSTVARFVTLQNVLVDKPGPIRKRGSISRTNASAMGTLGYGQLLPWTASNLYGGLTKAPYYATDSANLNGCADDVSAGTAVAAPGALIRCGAPFAAGGRLYAALGADYRTGPSTAINLWQIAGTVHAAISAGTATFTDGSTSVVLSSALSAPNKVAVVGSFLSNTSETAATRSVYRIHTVSADGLTLTLEEPYKGTAPGAGKTYAISSADFARSNNTVLVGTLTTQLSAAGVIQAATGAWGRIVLATGVRAGSAGTNSIDHRRLWWSGIVGRQDEGTAPWVGSQAFSATGYSDIDNGQGNIRALVKLRSALIAMCDFGIVPIFGSPGYGTPGSLNSSMFFPGATCDTGAWSYASWGDTLWFIDPALGLHQMSGGSPPVMVGDTRFNEWLVANQTTGTGAWRLLYYRQRVIGVNASRDGSGVYPASLGFIYYPTRDSFTTFTTPPYLLDVAIGRKPGSTSQRSQPIATVGTVSTTSSFYVANLGNIIDSPGDAAADFDGTSIVVDIKTGKIGSPFGALRPDRAYVTYRATDLSTTNPEMQLTVSTGLPDTSDSDHTFTTSAGALTETVDVETRLVEPINIGKDPMVQVRALQVNGAGKFDLYSLVLEGAYEGDGASS